MSKLFKHEVDDKHESNNAASQELFPSYNNHTKYT